MELPEHLTDQLNQQTQELNEKFLLIEKKLASMKLGVSAWCSRLIGIKPEEGTGYKFGFCRVNSSWKLVCRKVNINEPDDSENLEKIGYGLLKPITVMPRLIRLEASDMIEELIVEIVNRSNTYINSVNQAITDLEKTSNVLTEDSSNE